MSELTQDLLKSLLTYDPNTGVFTWRVNCGTRARAGNLAGCVAGDGYIQIKIRGCKYYAHRLAWLYTYGVWPADQLDHINRVKTDNRIANLRTATAAENNQNRGYAGVHWCAARRKWRVRICVNKKSISVGSYANHNDAISARKAAVIKYYTHRLE